MGGIRSGICERRVALLKQVKGVGTHIALTYFFCGSLCPEFLRPGSNPRKQPTSRLFGNRWGSSIVNRSAKRATGICERCWLGEDSDLRRWGLKLAERGGSQEASGGGGGKEISRAAASLVGQRRSLRTTAEQQASDGHRSFTSLRGAAELDRRVRVTATNSWPSFSRREQSRGQYSGRGTH